jgi:ABC-type Na+ efflux pump permease subunit
VWLVASREFLAAVANRGFVIGLLLMPAIFAGLFTLLPRLMESGRRADPRRGSASLIPRARSSTVFEPP